MSRYCAHLAYVTKIDNGAIGVVVLVGAVVSLNVLKLNLMSYNVLESP